MSTRMLSTVALALGLLPALAAPAWACGGFFCQRMPMDQAGERILFVQDGAPPGSRSASAEPGDTTAHVQIKYQGDAKKFSWVVPTPTEPKLGVGTDTLFAQLEQATRPTFIAHIKDLGNCTPLLLEERRKDMVYPAAAAPRMEGGVQVISQEKVGPYDSAVIRSNDPGALKAWLRKNSYEIPPKLDPLLDPYVAGRYYFVALKLQQDKGAGDLQPITLRYRASKPGIPIRLTAVAATPDMDLYVWVLGADRAIPENYRHATINEAKIDWLSGGSNYRQVVTQAANEAGGQAFVTDFAGKSAAVSLGILDGKRHDLAKLAKLTDPVKFLRAIQEDDYFQPGSPTSMAFVKRYVPLPKNENVWEPAVYSNPEQYPQLFKGMRVDAAKAARELDETVVKPFREVKRAFDRHPYLTRLYTTMSPEEMTQDPLFRTTSVMEDVSNVHEANGVRDCRRVKEYWMAPVTITLKNGTRFTIDPSKGNGGGLRRGWPYRGGFVPQMPAAQRVEQLQADGQGSLIVDNTPLIEAALAPEGGSPSGGREGGGAPHPAVPGLGLAGALLGLLGWRRWRGRR